jgi:hypothetical protein
VTSYVLSCGHTFAAAVDHELRDRLLCPDCYTDGAKYDRYVTEVQP